MKIGQSETEVTAPSDSSGHSRFNNVGRQTREDRKRMDGRSGRPDCRRNEYRTCSGGLGLKQDEVTDEGKI